MIETAFGVEEFDARDRPLVWRIVGGRTRFLLGGAELYVDDTVLAFAPPPWPSWPRRRLSTPRLGVGRRARMPPTPRRCTDCATPRRSGSGSACPPALNDLPDDAFRAAVADHPRLEGKAALPSDFEAFAITTLAGGALDWQSDIRITPDGAVLGTMRTEGGEDIAVIGLVGGAPLGIDACATLSRELAVITEMSPGRPILILVDTIGQKMSRSAELLGLNQAIGDLAQGIVLARHQGHRVMTLLLGKAAAAAFIALVLMAERVVALPEAEPAVLSLAAVARVTKMPLAELERLSRTTPVLAPGLEPMQALGAVQEVLPPGPALKRRLETLLLADTLDEPPDVPAARPYRDLIARVQSLVAGAVNQAEGEGQAGDAPGALRERARSRAASDVERHQHQAPGDAGLRRGRRDVNPAERGGGERERVRQREGRLGEQHLARGPQREREQQEKEQVVVAGGDVLDPEGDVVTRGRPEALRAPGSSQLALSRVSACPWVDCRRHSEATPPHRRRTDRDPRRASACGRRAAPSAHVEDELRAHELRTPGRRLPPVRRTEGAPRFHRQHEPHPRDRRWLHVDQRAAPDRPPPRRRSRTADRAPALPAPRYRA